MKEPRARLLVATPCYDGTLDVRYVESIVAATVFSLVHGVELSLQIESGHSLIQFARNRLASDFLAEPSFTHMLWLDSDVGFDPRAIVRLVDHGKDVVGGAYPVKDIPVWFPVEALPGENPAAMFRAKSLPTGFLLVSRKAMEAVAATVPTYVHHHKRSQLLTKHIFDLKLVGDVEPFELIGEDVLLCHRLAALGFELWCDPDINFFHSGRMEWQGNLKRRAELEQAQKPPEPEGPKLILPPGVGKIAERSGLSEAVAGQLKRA